MGRAGHLPLAGEARRVAQERKLRWWHGWGPLVVGLWLVVLLAPPHWPRWAVMWLLAAVIFGGCKWLTWRRTPVPDVPLWRHLGYLFAWLGLDARTFLRPDHAARLPSPNPREWFLALGKFAAGLVILFGATRLVPARHPYLAGWVGMTGIVMTLHFGLFHLLSCAWRAVGVEARPLMDRPLAATCISDFWGRRWNTAFRDLTHRFLFRPLARCFGPRLAVLAGFLFSGLVHDLVISWPAGGGYGGPTAYFLLQGLGILMERSRLGHELGLDGGWPGRLLTAVVVAAPAGFLFHRPFVLRVAVPFLQAVEAL